MNHVDSDPGLHLTPRGRRVLGVLIIVGLLVLAVNALDDLPPRLVLIFVPTGAAIGALLWQWWHEWR